MRYRDLLQRRVIPIITGAVMVAVSMRAAEPPGALSRDMRTGSLLPLPAQRSFANGSLPIDSTFRVALTGYREARLKRAAQRLMYRLSRQTGVPLKGSVSSDPGTSTLEISCGGRTRGVQSEIEDESYELVVMPQRARLLARTPYGALRGMETFLQLVQADSEGFRAPCVTIKDSPRFPWRGLLIDVCRHWMPIDVIKRNLDAMAAVKLNVLHWHLSEDQAFRVESRQFPKLHRQGSDGNYFTQEQVREVIAYAGDRGIRVVPEFDVPGHTTSWFVGHPELASAPGPYETAKTWGVLDATMDPTRETVYRFLDRFVAEMSALFPDPYFHIGGDEVTGKHWNENARIQRFMRGHSLKSSRDVQVYFNRRLQKILAKHGKKMVGWDEIFQPHLPKDVVVQSWRGQNSLAEAAEQGYRGILSFGYYLDHMRPASFHYAVDPFDKKVADLDSAAKGRILGGEACMWAEFVTPENVDSRIWPRAAAIAERLWSPIEVKDTVDMYRRLSGLSTQLEWVGITHRSSYSLMLQRIAGYAPIEPLKTLADVVEPIKLYERAKVRKYTTMTPLNRLVDAVRPESQVAREFSLMVDKWLSDSSSTNDREKIQSLLGLWRGNHAKLLQSLKESFLLEEIESLSENLSKAAEIGLRAAAAIRTRTPMAEGEKNREYAFLESAGKPQAEVLLMIVPSVRKLVEAAPSGTIR